MSGRTLVYMSAIAVPALLAIGQITLKTFADRLGTAGWTTLRDISIFSHVALPGSLAGVTYVVAAGLWIFVLHNLPANRAFLFVALAFVFVPILSHFVLGEEVSLGVLLGTVLIVVGILIGVLF